MMYRSEHASTERFAFGANIWSARFLSRNGITNYTMRFADRDGNELSEDGRPVPPRPANVSADARFVFSRWTQGEIERGTNKPRGSWKEWTEQGVLNIEKEIDQTGTVVVDAQYYADGVLWYRHRYGGSGALVGARWNFPDGRPELELESTSATSVESRHLTIALPRSWSPAGDNVEAVTSR
jgi:hypothetical protein